MLKLVKGSPTCYRLIFINMYLNALSLLNVTRQQKELHMGINRKIRMCTWAVI